MIETVSPWVLPNGTEYRRIPARPPHLRPPDYEAQFDSYTVFYDCFRLHANQVMLLGPPLHQFPGVLDSLQITSLPSGTICPYVVDHKFTTSFSNPRNHTLCRVVVDVPESDVSLQLTSTAGNAQLTIVPPAFEQFRGKRVLLTESRNNHLTWICDWMRFHRDIQNADAMLLYDNSSDAYSIEALLSAMQQVAGFSTITVVSWPFKFGPQGIGRGTWDSSSCQDGAIEDARWRFLAQAHAVLQCDIDELVLSEASLFDRAVASAAGCVKFHGRWVNAPTTEPTLRHRESTLQLRPRWRFKDLRLKDMHRCPTKWVVVPERCPPASQWTVHEIVGMPARTLRMAEACYRHVAHLSTKWKNNRTGIVNADRAKHVPDTLLQQAFTRVQWDS